jgi:hypothetical protein
LHGTARGYRLPSTLDDDPAIAVRQLDEWMRRTWRDYSDLLQSHKAETEERKSADRKLQAELSDLLNSRGELERKRTIKGMRWELAGLALVALGTMLQGVALL